MNESYHFHQLEIDLEHNKYYKQNPEYFCELKTLVETNPRSYSRKLVAKGKARDKIKHTPYAYLFDWIVEITPKLNELNHLQTRVSWILNGICDFPFCATCNKQDNYKTKQLTPFVTYGKHCCLACATQDDDVIQSRKDTKFELYGDENFVNPAKAKKTKKDRYGDENYVNTEKAKQTCLALYGETSYSKTEAWRESAIRTNIENLGVEWVGQSKQTKDKIKTTNQKKHGVDWFTQSNEFKQKSKDTFQKTYGCDFAAQSEVVIAKMRQPYVYDGKYFKTKPELALYVWLKTNDVDFEFQPKSDFWYECNGKRHKYQPDFKVGHMFVEIKGDQFIKEDGTWQNPYDHTQDEIYEAKHQCCIVNHVVILTVEKYQYFIDEVNIQFGKDYLASFKQMS